MGTTPFLGLPELSQGQANADITFNTALRLAQALLNGVIDRTNTPPGSPDEQDAYLVTATATGAWAGKENYIAVYIGAEWKFIPGNDDDGTPITMGADQEGMRVYVRDENLTYTWTDTAASPADYEWRVIGLSAAEVSNTPAGDIAATNVQTALNELDTEKVAKAGDTMTGELTVSVAGRALHGIQSTFGFQPADSVGVLESTDATSGGPTLSLYHNSASPAAGDTTRIIFWGNNASAAQIRYAQFSCTVRDTTAGSEDGEFGFASMLAGVITQQIAVGNGVWLGAATGSGLGTGTLNAVGVYDDGVLLCAPLHADNPAVHNQTFWNGIVPPRKIFHEAVVVHHPAVLGPPDPLTGEQEVITPAYDEIVTPAYTETIPLVHRTAQRYFDMVAGGFNPSDPASFFAYVDANKAVPGLPTLAEHDVRYPVVNGERVAVDKYSAHERMERMQLALDYMVLLTRNLYNRIVALETPGPNAVNPTANPR